MLSEEESDEEQVQRLFKVCCMRQVNIGSPSMVCAYKKHTWNDSRKPRRFVSWQRCSWDGNEIYRESRMLDFRKHEGSPLSYLGEDYGPHKMLLGYVQV